MLLWAYAVLVLAGIPLAVTWRKDLVSAEWTVVLSGILAASVMVISFAMVHGVLDHDTAWHVFMPEQSSPPDPPMTTEEYIKNMPPPAPVWPKISAYFLFMFLGPAFVGLIYKGSLFCLRSLRCRAPEEKNTQAAQK
ncbi:hypothetical protein [Roseimicrobium gellanilyticum]|nr:hypothetical protein [Roseimicrobium gellanilyticum]